MAVLSADEAGYHGTRPVDAPLRVMASSMALGAALIHAATMTAHPDDATFTLLYASAALFGMVWGVAAWARSGRVLLATGLVAHGAFLAFYVMSVTTGIWFVDALSVAQPITTSGLMAAFFDLGVVLTTAAWLAASRAATPAHSMDARSWAVVAVVCALCAPALVDATDATTPEVVAARAASAPAAPAAEDW